jgi:hypothetical protein
MMHAYAHAMQCNYGAKHLRCYREVIQKQDLPLPRQVTFDSNPGKLQEMVNSAVNYALINHSNVLSNTVHNVVV